MKIMVHYYETSKYVWRLSEKLLIYYKLYTFATYLSSLATKHVNKNYTAVSVTTTNNECPMMFVHVCNLISIHSVRCQYNPAEL